MGDLKVVKSKKMINDLDGLTYHYGIFWGHKQIPILYLFDPCRCCHGWKGFLRIVEIGVIAIFRIKNMFKNFAYPFTLWEICQGSIKPLQ